MYPQGGRDNSSFLLKKILFFGGRICKRCSANARGFPWVNPPGWLLLSA